MVTREVYSIKSVSQLSLTRYTVICCTNYATPGHRSSFEENLRRTWPNLVKLLMLISHWETISKHLTLLKNDNVFLREISILLPTKGFIFNLSTPPHISCYSGLTCPLIFLLAFLHKRFGFIESPLKGPLWEMYGYFLEPHRAKQNLQEAVFYQTMALCSPGSWSNPQVLGHFQIFNYGQNVFYWATSINLKF